MSLITHTAHTRPASLALQLPRFRSVISSLQREAKRGPVRTPFARSGAARILKRRASQFEPLGFAPGETPALGVWSIFRSYLSPLKKTCTKDWLPSAAGLSK